MFSLFGTSQKTTARIYLDHAAATPLRPEVVTAMREVEVAHFANPSAIHKEGVAARAVVEGARAKLARCLKVRPEGVTFTGSGTESNNLAILGTIYARRQAGTPFQAMEIISTAIEHPSVTATLEFVATLGVTVKTAPIDSEGRIILTEFTALLTPQTVLVTTAYVNSEVGTIQPFGKLVRTVRQFEKDNDTRVVVHTDAAQAPYWLPCQFDKVSVDVMSLDAGKCGGPKGVGVLVRRHGVDLVPVLHGGPQEGGVRPATENTVGIVGAVAAVVTAQETCEATSERIAALRDELLTKLEAIDEVVVNGSRIGRVANNINVSVPGVDSEFLTISLDAAGIAASTKSACSGASGGGSEVVRAMTGDEARAQSTLRITLGPVTTENEIEIAAKVIQETIATLQAQATQLSS